MLPSTDLTSNSSIQQLDKENESPSTKEEMKETIDFSIYDDFILSSLKSFYCNEQECSSMDDKIYVSLHSVDEVEAIDDNVIIAKKSKSEDHSYSSLRKPIS